jgi:raffinose/stachyose/melibiose transport system permease protein
MRSWNSYLLPLIVFTSQNHYTLPLAVASFQSTYTQDTARVYAFTSVSMIPALAIFIFAQRKLVGAIRG